MPKEIPLSTRGMIAIVDEDDFEKVSPYKWFVNNSGYIFTTIQSNNTKSKRATLYMSRLIMGNPIGYEIDHKNHNKLDNRKENLRLVTRSQNGQNRLSARKDSKTKVKGVFLQGKYYRVRLWVNKKPISFGLYKTIEEAEQVAKNARKQYMPFSPEAS